MASQNVHNISSHARGLRLLCGRKTSNPHRGPPLPDLCLHLLHRYVSALIYVFSCSLSHTSPELPTSTLALPDHIYARFSLAALFFLDHRSFDSWLLQILLTKLPHPKEATVQLGESAERKAHWTLTSIHRLWRSSSPSMLMSSLTSRYAY